MKSSDGCKWRTARLVGTILIWDCITHCRSYKGNEGVCGGSRVSWILDKILGFTNV